TETTPRNSPSSKRSATNTRRGDIGRGSCDGESLNCHTMAAVQLFALATTLLLGVLLAAVSRVIEARANGGSARRGLSTGEQRTALRLQVAARTILAIPLGLIGTMTIYAFGAGYLSRF